MYCMAESGRADWTRADKRPKAAIHARLLAASMAPGGLSWLWVTRSPVVGLARSGLERRYQLSRPHQSPRLRLTLGMGGQTRGVRGRGRWGGGVALDGGPKDRLGLNVELRIRTKRECEWWWHVRPPVAIHRRGAGWMWERFEIHTAISGACPQRQGLDLARLGLVGGPPGSREGRRT